MDYFNGGPDNCPAEPVRVNLRADALWDQRTSMEGRTIARPNPAIALQRMDFASGQHVFNGGPDNCPAEPSCHFVRALTPFA